MDIDLAVLRLMEREREIPFDELVQIIEQAILTAYLKHTGQGPDSGARAELDRKTGHVAIYVPERDDEGEVIGEAVDSPDDFGRIAAFAATQVINQRLRDIGDADENEHAGKDRDQSDAEAFVPAQHGEHEDAHRGEEREIARGQAVHRRLRKRAYAKRRA